ncbi:MAG: glycosyl hydrolase [Candidatus Sumerlaeota bacterium]|nr:glycosyl hydrolase [Candidatus Sumerlaeota bacterium]
MIHKLTRTNCAWLFAATMIVLMATSALAEVPDLARDFKNPPLALKSLPLWHLNGKLTTEEIAAQLRDSRDRSGFGGVAVLPVAATEPKYLTDEYFARYGDILENCKKLGLKVVFYDDIGFPSGSAGGLMSKQFRDDTTCRLDNVETDVAGPVAWEQALPKGIFMGAVAMNGQTLERRDISVGARNDRIAWQVPAGQWKIMIFTCVRAGGHVDYLCPESIDKFFSLTYDAYYKRFAPYFGSTIFMTFFDDVGVRSAERRVWTPAFNEKFKKKNGFSPVEYYPALWHDIGPDTEAARVALFDFRAELMAEGYPRKVHEWAAAHGIQSSGHAMGQYHPQPAFLGGDHIKFYRHSDVPMIDSIHYYGHGRPGFKLTSSAAWSYDRPLVAVEIYGNYREFDSVMLYRSGMELFARGANLFLPHGLWYDPKTVRIKPLISHFDAKIGPVLPEYNNWVGRASLLLQGGRHVADIGVLYPVASMLAFARLDAVVDQPKVKGSTHPGLYVPPQCDLNELSDQLTGAIRRDFTYLHPEILNERCLVKGPTLRLDNKTNYEDYRVIIIPAGRVIHWSNLAKIKQFYDAGGKVIATTQLPCKSAEFGHDNDVVETVRSMFGIDPAIPTIPINPIIAIIPINPTNLTPPAQTEAYSKRTNAAGGAAYFVPSLSGAAPVLASALNDALPDVDVRFETSEPAAETEKGMLSYLHKVKDGRNIYFFANSTDKRVEAFAVMRGKLALQSWNPHNGDMAALATTDLTEKSQHFTRARLQLDPVKSAFFVESQ